MDRFFDSNNPLMRFLARLVDLVILNVLTLVCSLPIITIGPAMTAMNYVMIHQAREEETYILQMYFRSLKSNLKQGIKLGLVYVAYALLTAADLFLLRSMNTRLTTLLMFLITLVTLVVLIIAVYSFGLLARFHNSVRATLKNAAVLTLVHIPRTLGMLLIWAGWAAVLIYLHGAAPVAILLYGVSLPAYMCTLLYDPLFRKMEQEEV